MKIRSIIFLIIVSLSIYCNGCTPAEKTDTERQEDVIEKSAGDRIAIAGSGVGSPIIKSIIDEYEKKNPDVVFDFLPFSHTSGGLSGTLSGDLDIGTISRELTAEEKDPRLEIVMFCLNPVVFITHRDRPIKNITTKQLLAVYSGKIIDWEELGSAPGKIELLYQHHVSTHAALSNLLFPKDFKFAEASFLTRMHVFEMLRTVCDEPNTIGYTYMSSIITARAPVNILAVDGHAPEEIDVASGRYPFITHLGVVIKKNAPDHVKAFIQYLFSEEAKQIMRESGYIPE